MEAASRSRALTSHVMLLLSRQCQDAPPARPPFSSCSPRAAPGCRPGHALKATTGSDLRKQILEGKADVDLFRLRGLRVVTQKDLD